VYIFILIYSLTKYNIDIAIFCQYRVDIVSKSKKWYQSITVTL